MDQIHDIQTWFLSLAWHMEFNRNMHGCCWTYLVDTWYILYTDCVYLSLRHDFELSSWMVDGLFLFSFLVVCRLCFSVNNHFVGLPIISNMILCDTKATKLSTTLLIEYAIGQLEEYNNLIIEVILIPWKDT